jgi:hypothetical protein
MKIHAAIRGTKLYVATWFAGTPNGNDHFIFVSDTLLPSANATIASAWSKAGRIAIATNKPYLAQESTNGWIGWTNAPGNSTAASSSSGNIMEGVIDLAQAFGSLPETIHIAVAAIQTDGNGTLVAQAPATKTLNGDIEPDEFLSIPVASIRDTRGDGKLDRLDPTRDFRTKAIQPTSSGLNFQVPTVPGIRYQLQYKATLADPWTDLGSPIQGLGSDSQSITADPPTPTEKGFFRLKALE